MLKPGLYRRGYKSNSTPNTLIAVHAVLAAAGLTDVCDVISASEEMAVTVCT